MTKQLPTILRAWHAGSADIIKKGFDPTAEGGEGNKYLGPGTYFTNDVSIARQYIKYRPDAVLYEVDLKTDGFYNPTHGIPANMIGVIDKITDEAKAVSPRIRRTVLTLKYGKAGIGPIVEALGKQWFIDRALHHGLTGVYEALHPNVFEVAVYDPSVVKLVSYKPEGPEAMDAIHQRGVYSPHYPVGESMVVRSYDIVPKVGDTLKLDAQEHDALDVMENFPRFRRRYLYAKVKRVEHSQDKFGILTTIESVVTKVED